MTVSVLYLCYQSLLEPLTPTQVVAYLEGLAQTGYKILLLTFEPRSLTETETREWQSRMTAKGIHWHWVRYHKSPTVPATAWDICVGIVTGFRLIRKHNLGLVHARSHVPGLMALALKRLTGIKLLFDLRGFMGEEYVDAGVWPPNGILFRLIKHAERTIVAGSDGIVVLTTKARDLLKQWYPEQIRDKPLFVIPCCVDLRHNPWDEGARGRLQEHGPSLVYVGKLGGWYLDQQMVDFCAAAIQDNPKIRLQVWTQSDTTLLQALIADAGIQERVSIGRVTPAELALALPNCSAGLAFIKPCFSKLASSPTKIGEYLAAGLPVVSTAGIGDVDELLLNSENGAVGVIVQNLDQSSYLEAACKLKAVLEDPNIRQRCRAVAEKNLDLESVGWTRYRTMYKDLLGS